MTPKEKAEELYHKYLRLVRGGLLNDTYHNKAKQAAVIAVDEVLSAALPKGARSGEERNSEIYWEAVKTEINKL